jgi:predicted DNA-binding protein with PD1-like motif
MALVKKVEGAEVFVGKLSYGGDLLGEITEFCTQKRIRLGWIQALGAVEKARVGF